MEALKKEEVLPLRNITQEEGVKFSKKAFARGQDRNFRQFILDHITDPVQPRTYPPNCDPDDKGHRRFHPSPRDSGDLCRSIVRCLSIFFILQEVEAEMNQMILERSNTFTTIREKFHHLALLGGAQFAANLTVDNTEGQLFVSGMNQWLWSSPSGLGSRTFTDQEARTAAFSFGGLSNSAGLGRRHADRAETQDELCLQSCDQFRHGAAWPEPV